MGVFDKFKSGSKEGGKNPLSMVMDFLGNPQKLKDTLMTQLYPQAEKSLLKYIDSVELQEGEAQTAIVLFKNGDKLSYILATFDDQEKAIRQIDQEDVREKLESMADKLKLF